MAQTEKRKLIDVIAVLVILTFCASTGCVKIPAESIKLNQLVKTNLIDIHQKHKNLVHAYFELKIEIFDSWFLEKYAPAYLKSLSQKWDEDHQTNPFDISKPECREAYTRGSIAEYEYFVGQIHDEEQKLDKALDDAYNNLIIANDAVTDLLQSNKALSDEQRRLYNNTAGKLIPSFDPERISESIKKIGEDRLKKLGNG